MQLVIPMAGSGSRFTKAGYVVPKPLLDLDGKKMYQRVFENLCSNEVSRIIFITNPTTSFDIKNFKTQNPNFEIHQKTIDYLTDGPARTVSLVAELLDLDSPLVIANSDQLVAYPVPTDYQMLREGYDGIVWCMQDNDPKWSYVETNNEQLITNVVEKEVISNLATVGIYAYGKARYFFEAFDLMVSNEDTVNNEYYVAPTYNYLLGKQRILARDLGEVSNVVFGLGIPEDYEKFMEKHDREQVYAISSGGFPNQRINL